MLPKQFQNLIKYFTKFPGIGSRQATRFVFHLLRQPNDQFTDFINELTRLKNEIKICPNCFFIFDSLDLTRNKQNGGKNKVGSDDSPQVCQFCSDPKRNQNIICVVEKEADILAIERTGHHGGTYHILGGNIYTLAEESENFIINNLKNRLEKSAGKNIELILALNPTPEGDATASFILRELKNPNIKITRLARGLQRGADLEYADHETLSHAIQNRK